MAEWNMQSIKPVAGGGNTLVPEGTYMLRVKSTNFKLSGKGNTMIETLFEIAEGEFAGVSFFHYFTLRNEPEKAANMDWGQFKHFLLCCGLDGGALSVPDHYGDKDNPQPVTAMHGLCCSALVGIEQGNYKDFGMNEEEATRIIESGDEPPKRWPDKNRAGQFFMPESGAVPAGVPAGASAQSEAAPPTDGDAPPFPSEADQMDSVPY